MRMIAAIERADSCLAGQVREPIWRVVIPPSLCRLSAQNWGCQPGGKRVAASSVATPLPMGATRALTVQKILSMERTRVDRSDRFRPG